VNIYVGNLPYNTTEEDLMTLFSEYGEVKSVSIIKDRDTNRSRGFGFVEMSEQAEAEAAIAALNGSSHGGRTLNVSEAKPRAQSREPRSGGFGRERGGRRW